MQKLKAQPHVCVAIEQLIDAHARPRTKLQQHRRAIKFVAACATKKVLGRQAICGEAKAKTCVGLEILVDQVTTTHVAQTHQRASAANMTQLQAGVTLQVKVDRLRRLGEAVEGEPKSLDVEVAPRIDRRQVEAEAVDGRTLADAGGGASGTENALVATTRARALPIGAVAHVAQAGLQMDRALVNRFDASLCELVHGEGEGRAELTLLPGLKVEALGDTIVAVRFDGDAVRARIDEQRFVD